MVLSASEPGFDLMKFYFFPRDKLFWIFHCSVLTALSLMQLIGFIFWRDDVLFNISGGLLWLPLFTLAVFYYRKLYKTYNWQSLSITKTIPLVMGYGAVSGFTVAIVMLGILIPIFFWDPLTNATSSNDGIRGLLTHIIEMVGSNGFITQLVICAWISLYIGVTSSRRSKETELINLRLQNSLREAQLSSLTNQLNPHFLFNGLNNIRFMIHENPARADRMITELSEMLRYSLETSRKDKVLLSEEIAMIAHYIDIVKIQLEERLQFLMAIPDNLYQCLVPPMILQMLAENAVKHGLDNLPQGGRLRINGKEEQNHIVFDITNDIAAGDKSMQPCTGIGLANIEQRLKLLYNDQASLEVTRNESDFSVLVRIPKESDQ